MGSFLPPINQSVPASNCFGEIDMDEVKIIFDRQKDGVKEDQFGYDNPFAIVDQNKSPDISPKKRETGGFGFEISPTLMQEPKSESSFSLMETPQPDITVQCKCKATVLLVDDSLFQLYPIQKMIQSEYKLHCDTALNGLVAYNKVKQSLTK